MEESPPRNVISVVDGGTKSHDDISENREKHSFLGAIMGGFSAWHKRHDKKEIGPTDGGTRSCDSQKC